MKKKQPQLSATTRYYLKEIHKKHNKIIDGFVYQKYDGLTYIRALIKVTDAAEADRELKKIKAAIGTKAGNIWTVGIPVEKVTAITKFKGISYIELDQAVNPNK